MIEKSKVHKTSESLKVNKGQVVSENIFNDENIDVAAYVFSEGEMITYEKCEDKKIYLSLKNKTMINFKKEGINENTLVLNPYDFVVMDSMTERELYSDDDFGLIMMTFKRSEIMLKNIDKEKVLNLMEELEYEENKIVSKTLAKDEKLIMTLMAFKGKQELSTHSAPGDALVIALDGEARINIDGNDYTVKKGESIIMPANIPHGVYVTENFKMLLTVSK